MVVTPSSKISPNSQHCRWKRCHLLGQEETNKHNEIWRDTSRFGLQASRGCVPFVPWKCLVCPADILSSLSSHPGTRPEIVPGMPPRHTDRQISFCVFCLSVFLLPDLVLTHFLRVPNGVVHTVFFRFFTSACDRGKHFQRKNA